MGLVYKASKGIPRRINSLCDRLMLAGFLSARHAIGAEDVNEVVNELALEGTMGSMPAGLNGVKSAETSLDLDVTNLSLDAGAADAISQHLGTLVDSQHGDRLQRLERGMLRLEQTNLETLEILKKLVNSVRKPTDGDAP